MKNKEERNVYREVRVLIPKELAEFVEGDMELSLIDTCQKIILDILNGWKEARGLNGKENGK